jgi:uncharacterized protein YuzE
MKERYLEVTFRRGRPIAAHYYLSRQPGEKSVRTRRAQPGMLVDFSRAGRPIGIEITAPSKMALSALNRLLRDLGFSAVTRNELAPVLAA